MVEKVKQTKEEMELEMTRLELEAKQLEVEERKAHIVDLKESLAEREMKRETKRQGAITNGQSIRNIAEGEALQQKRCSHKKGGNGAMALVKGGNDQQYSVLRHTFHTGDTWVRCLRCGKTWKPPLESAHTVDGKFNQASFDRAVEDYRRAIDFDTRNITSGGVMFKWSDGGAYAREQMAATTLR